MKLLVTGAGGQLGRELIRAAADCRMTAVGLDRRRLDITDAAQVAAAFERQRPRVVVNAAAYTRVDEAEDRPQLATAINATAAGRLADACRRHGAVLIQVSTDYVFDGRLRRPYVEEDPVAPLNVYGRSKAEGEALVRARLKRHLIVRTSWLYSAHGANFVKTILRAAAEQKELRVVDDQYGSPTSAADLADALVTVAGRAADGAELPWGTYHYCNRGVASWHAFAERILGLLPQGHPARRARLVPIPSTAWPTAARRPAYSALDCARFEAAFGRRPPEWPAALAPVLARLAGLTI